MRLRPMIRYMLRALPIALVSVAILAMALPAAADQSGSSGNGLARGHAKDVVIVGYESSASRTQRGKAAVSVGATNVRKISPLADDTVVMKLPPGQSVEKAIGKLNKQSAVSYAEPDYFVHAAETSDDPYFLSDDLWGMQGATSTPSNQYGSGAAEAWALGAIGSSEVYVAVLDQGVKTDHEDLAANMDVARNWDFLSDDPDVFDSVSYSHGTHVAGTVGARGGNGVGVAGVNWRVKMISAKMLGPEPESGAISNTVAAIDYITALRSGGLNVVVINASWGYEGPASTPLLEAIQRAGDSGILFVAAAGNYGKDTDTVPFYPASYDCSTTESGEPRGWDCIISVANIDDKGRRSSTSNYGDITVDLGAPGTAIYSTYPGAYATSSGTSMAAPHVSGAVALCASLDPSLGPAMLRERVLTTVAATNSMSGKTVTGGRLDIGAMAPLCGAPVAVPDLSGLASAAPGTLGAAGLVGSASDAYSASVALGEVISQDPLAGTLVAPGSSVSYVVSLGPEPVAVPPTVVVDDLSRQFVRRGGGWNQAPSGYKKHHFWVPTRAGSSKRVAKWTPTLAAPGEYRVEVRIPRAHATTRSAVYKIRTADAWVKRVRNQNKHKGRWVSLGVHRLSATPVVKLKDKTGERTLLGRSVAFDAVRFIPTGFPVVSAAVAAQSTDEPEPTKAPVSAPGSHALPAEATEVPPSDASAAPTAIEAAAPRLKSQPTPGPRSVADPRKAQAPEREPSRAGEPRAARQAKPEKVKPDSTRQPRPEPEPKPKLVLVIQPQKLVLTVGESKRIAAFVCAKDIGPGPDKEYGTTDDGCTLKKNVEWSLMDPAVAVFTEGNDRKTKLSAATATTGSKLIARAGDLTAKIGLKIKPTPKADNVHQSQDAQEPTEAKRPRVTPDASKRKHTKPMPAPSDDVEDPGSAES